jgi:hypothetical protein
MQCSHNIVHLLLECMQRSTTPSHCGLTSDQMAEQTVHSAYTSYKGLHMSVTLHQLYHTTAFVLLSARQAGICKTAHVCDSQL